MSAVCAALLAAMLPGVSLADLDRNKVYEVPAQAIAGQSAATLRLARGCASRSGIRYKIVDR